MKSYMSDSKYWMLDDTNMNKEKERKIQMHLLHRIITQNSDFCFLHHWSTSSEDFFEDFDAQLNI